ncbi:FAD:protein FMN transferase [Lederbergia graminis]|uniref:FAD:protein FMN transferase n=1 Tax=Lederbergia graminis TaxID=735518 RepID=A0ABW0LEL0_9BACI
MYRKLFIGICILTISLTMYGCGKTNSDELQINSSPYKRTEFLMGTVVTVKIYDADKETVLDRIFQTIETLANQLTSNDIDSEIANINHYAGEQPVEVSDSTLKLIVSGKDFSESVNGLFDITIGPLTSLWSIGFPDARKPGEEEIEKALSLIDYKKIEINEMEHKIYLQDKGMRLDLGAIAKGFITDEVNKLLEEEHVTTAIIDLGGNIYVKGLAPSGKQWTVGIQDPYSPRGTTIGNIQTTNKSVVTSGIYERFLEVEGVKYHHLLNPTDGYPFNNEIAGVTIISEESIDGDALSTSVFAMGLEAGMDYIESVAGVEAIFVSTDKQVFLTTGIANFELTSNAYRMGEMELK